MPWIIAGGMVAGTVIGGLMSKGSRNKSASAADRQADASQDQVDLGRETLDWNKDKYADWEKRFDPIFSDMMDSLDDDLTPNYAAIAGDVKSGFQSARGQERRELQRYGVRPQDGAMAKSEREYGIREAAAHVGTRSEARESKRGLKYNRLASVTGMGYGIQPSVLGGVNQAGGNLGNAYGAQANTFGNQSTMYANNANQIAGGVGNMVGSMPWGEMWTSTRGWANRGSNDPSYGQYGSTKGQTMGPPAPSDIRLKTNINPVGKLLGYNVYTWDWNDLAIKRGVTGTTFGVIAQEVPDKYVTEVDGYLTVDYGKLFGEAK